MIDRIAAQELFDPQHQFNLLMHHVFDESDMKEAILKVIADNDDMRFNTSTQKMDYFREEMSMATSPLALQKALWAGIQRRFSRYDNIIYII